MARSIYIASPTARSGRTTVALGLAATLTKVVAKVGVFRPFVPSRQADPALELLLAHSGCQADPAECMGVTWAEYHADPEESLTRIVDAYRALARKHDVVVIDGSGADDTANASRLPLAGRVAANLGAPVLLVLSGYQEAQAVREAARAAIAEISGQHARTVAVVANRCTSQARPEMAAALATLPEVAVSTLPEVPALAAPTLAQLAKALGGTFISGQERSGRPATSLLVAGMGASHVVERMRPGQLAIVPADRAGEILPLAANSGVLPELAALVLNGGFETDAAVQSTLAQVPQLPVITTNLGTFEAASAATATTGDLLQADPQTITEAIATFEAESDMEALLAALEVEPSEVVTPIMFQAELVEKARADQRTIVLPEPDDDRVLRAADIILRRGIAQLILLGDEASVRARGTELGLDLSAARVVSPHDEELVEKYAAEFARLRAKKGVTLEQAREKVQDVSYFGTMMVHMGDAHGMVSGAAHTTAHTIVPSFQIIKTKPGTAIVSSVFLMLLADRVLVYGDCAVNPEPSSEELADIAISSAATARQFGIQPRVAMLSFSTGTSGKGADVDKVREATELVRAKAPELAVEGPIQYDAAVDAAVAAKKAPGSAVAGKANVFIFPDLSAGNIGYKAVQRSSGAVAIGPVLQGLNKPVNDLSRGALVEDIVNTVAITAVQAQG